MQTQTVNYRGLDLEVTYKLNGNCIPATHFQPAEYQEAEIFKITLVDSEVDISCLFMDELTDINDLIEI